MLNKFPGKYAGFRHRPESLIFPIAATILGLVPQMSASAAANKFANHASHATVTHKGLQQPLYFEKNAGQVNAPVDFVSHGDGYNVYLSPGTTTFGLHEKSGRVKSVQMSLVGADHHAQAIQSGKTPAHVNYLIGKDRSKWIRNLETFHQAGFKAVYPGVDVVYYGHGRQLEYDFDVAPGASPSDIQFSFAGASAKRQSDGSFCINLPVGSLKLLRPVAYQVIGGHKTSVPSSYRQNANGSIGFAIGKFNRTVPLVIDPLVVYSTYIGGSGIDHAQAAGSDLFETGYVAGYTTSADFPKTVGGTLNGTRDAFVAKYDYGGQLLWATYFGGTGADTAYGMAVDPATGQSYIVGQTSSTNFPTPGGFQTTNSGGQDAFLIRLSPDGSTIQYGTYLGGSGVDIATSVAIKAGTVVYVGGSTASNDFPAPSNLQPFVLGTDGFVDSVDTSITGAGSLLKGTYIGGASSSQVNGVASDSSGAAYLCGIAGPGLVVTPGAKQTAFGGGSSDGFVAKVKPDFSGFNYETYLGGTLADSARAIAVDSNGLACVTGFTSSADFPIRTGGFLTTYPAGSASNEAFYTKLSADGKSIQASTFFGGGDFAGPPATSGGAQGNGIALDSTNNVFIVGAAGTNMQFPTNGTSIALQPSFGGGGSDAFVAEFTPDGATLLYSTYLGGAANDAATGISVVGASAYISGETDSADFPTLGYYFTPQAFGGVTDGFAVKLGLAYDQPVVTGVQPNPVYAGSTGQVLQIDGLNFALNGLVDFPGNFVSFYTFINTNTVTVVVPDSIIATPGTVNALLVNGDINKGLAPFKFTVVSNPVPTITSIAPTSVYAGSPAFKLAIVGTNFENRTTVKLTYGSGPSVFTATSTVTDSSHMTITVPAAAIALEGNVTITVSNPTPGGGTATATLVVNRIPTPTITSLDPNPILVGTVGVNLTIIGTGYVPGMSTVLLNDVAYPATVQPSKIVLAVPDFLLATAGTVTVKVVNPSPDAPSDPDGGTAEQDLMVFANQLPTITSLSPNPVTAGYDGTVLTITGTGFNPNSRVSFDGSQGIAALTQTATQLTVAIPSSALSLARTVTVTVTNPAPGGGAASSPLSVVYGPPVINTLSPTNMAQGTLGGIVTLTGLGFTQASTVTFNGVPSGSVSYVDGTKLTVVVPNAGTDVIGLVKVIVSNPAPGGPSNPAYLTIVGAGLKSISVSPSTALGGASVTGTVTLNAPAPAGGVVVTLSSSLQTIAPVPATVTINSGQVSATFTIPTKTVSGATAVTLSATLGAAPVKTKLTLNPFAGNGFAKGLRFFSIPFDYPSDPLDGLFGYTGVKLATWVGDSGQYAITPGAPADHIRLGRGYWGRFPGAVQVTHIGTPADPTVDFVVPLAAGWNQIGVPFQVGTMLQDITFSNGTVSYADASGSTLNLIQANVYGYDAPASGAPGAYAVIGAKEVLSPGSAYWIKAFAPTNMTFPHPVAAAAAQVTKVHSETIRLYH